MTGCGIFPPRRPFPGLVDRDQLVFADFEASGLGPDTWPIELGLARVEADGTVSSEAHLIRPHPSWSMSHWSAASARVHGIAREVLDAAAEAQDVASLAIQRLSDKVVVSDAPEFDGRWLHKLTRIVDRDLVIPIHDLDAVLAASCDREGLKRAYAALERLPQPHRAGDDAARLAHAWRAGVTR